MAVHSLRIVAVLVLGTLACAGRYWYTGGTTIERMDPFSNPVAASDDPGVRRLSYALVHGMYMKLLVWPSFLCYDYSMDAVPLVHSLGDLRLLLPCAGYLVLAQVACVSVSLLRTRAAAVLIDAEGPTLGFVIFALSFLPMANLLFPVGTLVAERLLYIPSVGFLVAAVSGARLLALQGRGGQRRMVRNAAALTVLLLATGHWGVACYRRVQEWRTVEEITVADGLRQLRSQRTQFNIGNIYLQAGRFEEALAAYKRSTAADPLDRDSLPLYHAGQIFLYHQKYDEAEAYLQKAVTGYFSPLTMAEEEVWHDYGLALWHVGKGAEAVQNFQNALITNPAFPKGYNNLGCALVLMGLSSQPQNAQVVREGLAAIEQAIGLNPSVPMYWRNAAAMLGLTGDVHTAQEAWQRFSQLDPGQASALTAANGGGLPRDCIWEFYFR